MISNVIGCYEVIANTTAKWTCQIFIRNPEAVLACEGRAEALIKQSPDSETEAALSVAVLADSSGDRTAESGLIEVSFMLPKQCQTEVGSFALSIVSDELVAQITDVTSESELRSNAITVLEHLLPHLPECLSKAVEKSEDDFSSSLAELCKKVIATEAVGCPS